MDEPECKGKGHHSGNPDLRVYVSHEKTPDQDNSSQTFVNPGCRILIKKPENETAPQSTAAQSVGDPVSQAVLKKQEREAEDTF